MRKEFCCTICPKTFSRAKWEIAAGRTRFCSKACGDASRKTGKEVECLTCKTSFYVEMARLKRGLATYCSKSCKMKAERSLRDPEQANKKCLNCDVDFSVQAYRKDTSKFCSLSCKGTYEMTGERSHNWKGGITPISKRLRSTKEYEDFRVTVFKRDDYTCQKCGVRGGTLEVDHVMPVVYFPEMMMDALNGQTLCITCHKKTPTWGHKVHSWFGDLEPWSNQFTSKLKTDTNTWQLI